MDPDHLEEDRGISRAGRDGRLERRLHSMCEKVSGFRAPLLI